MNPARYSAFRSLLSLETTVKFTMLSIVSVTPEAWASGVDHAVGRFGERIVREGRGKRRGAKSAYVFLAA